MSSNVVMEKRHLWLFLNGQNECSVAPNGPTSNIELGKCTSFLNVFCFYMFNIIYIFVLQIQHYICLYWYIVETPKFISCE